MTADPITEPAPAKINLALHVTGRRTDGYHLLDSLVVFTEMGDSVTVDPMAEGFSVTGPFADDVPPGGTNLCLRAAALAGARVGIALHKALPVASGIGGGSADAAAVLRGLARLGHAMPPDIGSLGADLPVCLAARPARMRGIGEVVEPVPGLPRLDLVLCNPRLPLSTPEVFAALTRRDNPGLPRMPAFADAAALTAWLAGCRNDLEAAAISRVPVIADIIAALSSSGAMLARMSGSGATCFGIFPDAGSAQAAAARLASTGWWAAATRTRA